MCSHHVQAVKEVLKAKKVILLYYPSYSPDRNPIEKMWTKVKAILRGWKIRSLDACLYFEPRSAPHFCLRLPTLVLCFRLLLVILMIAI